MKYLSPGEGAGSAPDNPKPSTLPLMSVWRVMMSTMPLSTRLQAEVKVLMTPSAAPAWCTLARSRYRPSPAHKPCINNNLLTLCSSTFKTVVF